MTADGLPGQGSTAIRRRLIALAAAIILTLNGAAATWILAEQRGAVGTATAAVINTSRLLASVMDSELGAIDKVLVGIGEMVALHPGPARIGNATILGFLHRHLTLARSARAFLVIGPDGHTLYGTNLVDPTQPVDLSDRPYFRHHLTQADDLGYLGAPVISRNDGSWIVALSRRLSNPDGSFAGVVAATVDLSKLAQSMSIATPSQTDAAVLVNLDGVILARSPGHRDFVGRSVATLPAFQSSRELKSSSGTLLSPLDGRHRLFGSTRSNQFPLLAVVSRDVDDVLADWHMQGIALTGATASVTLIIILLVIQVLRQLTRVDRTLADLAQARIAADAANQAKSAFLANMSHEFRTPLNAILGFSEALVGGLPGHQCSARCQTYLGHVQSSGHHLLDLVNDILDLSKIEVGKAELDREAVDLTFVARDCLALLSPKAGEKSIQLRQAGLDRPLILQADSRRVRQILLNLLSNAVKFTPANGSVTVAAEDGADSVTVAVNDSGIGMSEAEIETALTPFGQNISDVARAEGGTGLGLPLAKRLAELHGGTLTIASIKGEGTTVTLVLPKE